MTSTHPIGRYLLRHPFVGALGYVGIVLVLTFTTWAAVADIRERQVAIAAAGDLLDQIEGRRKPTPGSNDSAGPIPAGSPFLEGQTVTVAGAAILQRAAGAVRKYGGNVLSSQVELEGTQSKGGLVSVILSCELAQPQLQQLLYDLEVGMPFLFVDQLVIQSPQGYAGAEGVRLRVLLGVSGQWEGTK